MNDETMMNVVDIYEVHHLTVEMTLKDRQDASMFGECAILTMMHGKGGKLRRCQNSKM